MTDREIILESRIAELETEKLGMLTKIFNLEQKTADLERRLGESCAQNVADNYLVPALSQEADNLKARNAELVEALEKIDKEVCGMCSFVLDRCKIYPCRIRRNIQSVIRAGNV